MSDLFWLIRLTCLSRFLFIIIIIIIFTAVLQFMCCIFILPLEMLQILLQMGQA